MDAAARIRTISRGKCLRRRDEGEEQQVLLLVFLRLAGLQDFCIASGTVQDSYVSVLQILLA